MLSSVFFFFVKRIHRFPENRFRFASIMNFVDMEARACNKGKLKGKRIYYLLLKSCKKSKVRLRRIQENETWKLIRIIGAIILNVVSKTRILSSWYARYIIVNWLRAIVSSLPRIYISKCLMFSKRVRGPKITRENRSVSVTSDSQTRARHESVVDEAFYF